MNGRKIENSPMRTDSTTRTFAMPSLIETIKLLVLVNWESEYREKTTLKGFSLVFSDYQDSDAREKTKKFQLIFVYKCCVLEYDFDAGNRNCSDWELKVWISIVLNKKEVLGIFGMSRICCMDQNLKMLNESSSAVGKFAIETLIGDIIRSYWEKIVFNIETDQ